MPSVGVYLRISRDPGEQQATARQRADCVALCAARGWDIAGVYEDVDVSAYKRRVVRPQFEAMLEAIRAGEIMGVVGWRLDRIARQHRDLSRLMDALEDAKGFVATVADSIDTRTQGGRLHAEILTSLARTESENISTRVKRAALERARAGKPSGGGRRPFGLNADRTELVPHEAELVREAAQRILDGESLRGVVTDWHRRGIRTVGGTRWASSTLRRLLCSWHIAGQREVEGRTVEASWPPIVQIAAVERLRAILQDPSRRNAGVGAPRKYLLSGLATCGRCGTPLVSKVTAASRARYVCPPGVGCGGIARQGMALDAFVRDAILAVLDGVDVSRFESNQGEDHSGELVQQIRDDEHALEDLASDYYVRREITRAMFYATRDTLQARIEANRALLARASRSPLAGMVDVGREVGARWERETVEWRRAVVTTVIDRIAVLPAKSGTATFDPSSVAITWKF
ncbi:MAG: recombinase family protein [Dehalococcoidia bacterium]|nr:recombinase family protein [Dehalococcoidia bacterium]